MFYFLRWTDISGRKPYDSSGLFTEDDNSSSNRGTRKCFSSLASVNTHETDPIL